AAEPLLAAERPFAGVAHVLGIPARVGGVAAPGKIPGATHLVAKGCYRPGICQKNNKRAPIDMRIAMTFSAPHGRRHFGNSVNHPLLAVIPAKAGIHGLWLSTS